MVDAASDLLVILLIGIPLRLLIGVGHLKTAAKRTLEKPSRHFLDISHSSEAK